MTELTATQNSAGLYIVQVPDIGGTPAAITDINAPECVAAAKEISKINW